MLTTMRAALIRVRVSEKAGSFNEGIEPGQVHPMEESAVHCFNGAIESWDRASGFVRGGVVSGSGFFPCGSVYKGPFGTDHPGRWIGMGSQFQWIMNQTGVEGKKPKEDQF